MDTDQGVRESTFGLATLSENPLGEVRRCGRTSRSDPSGSVGAIARRRCFPSCYVSCYPLTSDLLVFVFVIPLLSTPGGAGRSWNSGAFSRGGSASSSLFHFRMSLAFTSVLINH